MIPISNAIKRSLCSGLNSAKVRNDITGSPLPRYDTSLDKQIIIPIDKEELEIPAIFMYDISDCMYRHSAMLNPSLVREGDCLPPSEYLFKEIVHNLNTAYDLGEAKSASPVFSKIFSSSYFSTIITSKGDRYFGYPGLLLNSEGELLYLITYKGKIKRIGTRFIFIITDRKVYINPEVFITDKFVEKNLAKFVIPIMKILHVTLANFNTDYISYDRDSNLAPDLIIDKSIQEFMKGIPSPNTLTTNEEAYKTLSDSLEGVIQATCCNGTFHFL